MLITAAQAQTIGKLAQLHPSFDTIRLYFDAGPNQVMVFMGTRRSAQNYRLTPAGEIVQENGTVVSVDEVFVKTP
jgi:hypothetical protein